MKAQVFDRYGGPDVLRAVDLPIPSAGPGQVVISVAAAGVNPADWRLRSGQFKRAMRLKLPFTPGNDVSGRIVEVGAGVTRFSPGDAVFAMTPLDKGGACAEFALVDADLVAPAPSTLSIEDAAAMPLAGLTALQALRTHGRLRAGQSLLVAGASGGVGHFAVQIGKAMGARVGALCSAGNASFVRTLGADDAYDYADRTSYEGPKRFDLVFDAVAKESVLRWRNVLRARGTVVTVNPVIGKIVPDIVAGLFGIPHLRSFFVKPGSDDLQLLARLVDEGKVKPYIEARFSLNDLAEAHRRSAEGHVRGKLSIDVTPPVR